SLLKRRRTTPPLFPYTTLFRSTFRRHYTIRTNVPQQPEDASGRGRARKRAHERIWRAASWAGGPWPARGPGGKMAPGRVLSGPRGQRVGQPHELGRRPRLAPPGPVDAGRGPRGLHRPARPGPPGFAGTRPAAPAPPRRGGLRRRPRGPPP